MAAVELRPLGLGELLDRAFTLYRNHFWLFVGITAIPASVAVPVSLVFSPFRGLSAAGPKPSASYAAGAGAGMLALLFGLLFLLTYAMGMGAVTFAVSESYLGLTATVRGSYRKVRGKLWRIMGVVINVVLRLIGMMILVAISAGIIIGGLAAVAGVMGGGRLVGIIMAIVFFVAYLALIGFFLLWSQRYAISIPAMLLENLGVNAAIRRSVQLTRGRRWQIFVGFVLASILSYIGVIVFQGPFLAAMLVSARTGTVPVWLSFTSAVCGAVGGSLTGPLLMIVLVLYYYDTRIRKEAFDLQFMMSSLDRPAAAPGTTAPA